MKITSKRLAWVCVALLTIYPASAFLVHSYMTTSYYSIMAALFAVNAGTALVVGLVFRLSRPYYSTSGLQLAILIIVAFCAFVSALFWMLDVVDNIWLLIAILSPVFVIHLVMVWFVDNMKMEVKAKQGEGVER